MNTLDPLRIQEVIDACLDACEKLNDWELSFLYSISDQYDRFRTLTEKQLETLEKIYLKV